MLICSWAAFTVFAAYFASFVLYFLNFELRREALSRWARRTLLGGLALQAVLVGAFFVKAGSLALVHFSEYIFMGSFLVLAASILLERLCRARFLPLFSLPVALLFCLLSFILFEGTPSPDARASSGWLWIHTGLILAGLTALVTAACCAVMYLLQSAQLKSKHLGNVFLKLPSLGALDRLHFRALVWGVVLFSSGLLSGFLWAKEIRSPSEILGDPKAVLSFWTCVLYWVVLSFRLSTLRRGQKIAAGTVLVFVLLFATLLSSVYMPYGFHGGF